MLGCKTEKLNSQANKANTRTFLHVQIGCGSLLSAGSDKNHAKWKFLSTWWSTDFSKNYRVGMLSDLLFSPNLFFSKIIALLRKSGLYFLSIILTFSLKSMGKWWRKSATFFVTFVDEDANVTCTGMKLNYWTTLTWNKMRCKMGMCPIISVFCPWVSGWFWYTASPFLYLHWLGTSLFTL